MATITDNLDTRCALVCTFDSSPTPCTYSSTPQFITSSKANWRQHYCSRKWVLITSQKRNKDLGPILVPFNHHHTNLVHSNKNNFYMDCSKDMGSYPSLISFTSHYLAFVSHDSLPYLSVVVMWQFTFLHLYHHCIYCFPAGVLS